jgi:hypothetical protein
MTIYEKVVSVGNTVTSCIALFRFRAINFFMEKVTNSSAVRGRPVYLKIRNGFLRANCKFSKFTRTRLRCGTGPEVIKYFATFRSGIILTGFKACHCLDGKCNQCAIVSMILKARDSAFYKPHLYKE